MDEMQISKHARLIMSQISGNEIRIVVNESGQYLLTILEKRLVILRKSLQLFPNQEPSVNTTP